MVSLTELIEETLKVKYLKSNLQTNKISLVYAFFKCIMNSDTMVDLYFSFTLAE